MHTHGRYPMIPIFEMIPGEPPNDTGRRALAHVQTHGTATLPDEAIEQGIRIATIALAGTGIAATAADRITSAVHQLRAALRYRTALDTQERTQRAEQRAEDTNNPGGGQRTEAPRTPPPSFTPPGTHAPMPRRPHQMQRDEAPIF